MTEILHLIDTYRIGGPGKTIINSATFIDRQRYRVHIGAFTHPDPARHEFARAVRDAGIPFLELRETRRFNIGHIAQIRRYVKERRIAIVHAHGYRTDALGYLSTRGLAGVSIVTTHHGWIRNSRKQRVIVSFAKWLCGRFDGVEAVSGALLRELPRSIQAAGRAVIVHNGIVLQDYVPEGRRDAIRQALGIGDDDTLLGVIGRLSPEKGCLEMLDAFVQVTSRNARVHLVFVGEGPLAPILRDRVRELNLIGRVHFVPHQCRIQPFYEAIDVVVSPSLTEGLSNVILEAHAFRRPVVATQVGGNGEIIEADSNGLLVPPRQPSALSAAICRVLDDEDLRRRLTDNGYRRVSSDFSFATRMRKEEQFYERVLDRASS